MGLDDFNDADMARSFLVSFFESALLSGSPTLLEPGDPIDADMARSSLRLAVCGRVSGQSVSESAVSTRANSGEGLTTVSAEQFRSPLGLYSSSKTHLAAENRKSKCQGLNDHTFLAGRNPCRGCSKRARSPRASPPSKTPERLKKKPTGQPVLYHRPGSAALQLSAPAAHWTLEGQLCRRRPST